MPEERRGAYTKAGKSFTSYGQMQSLSQVRATPPEYAGGKVQVLQDVVKRLGRSFKGFFRRFRTGQKAGSPRFNSGDCHNSFTYLQPGQNNGPGNARHVDLSKIGNVRIKLHCPFCSKLKTLAVKREGQEWYAVLTFEPPRPAPLPSTANAVGIDLGVAHIVIVSDGEFVNNLHPLRTAQKRLRVLRRSLNREQRGSRLNARRAVARLHLKVKRRRDDLLYKAATKLVRENDRTAHEHLSITRTLMARKRAGRGLGQPDRESDLQGGRSWENSGRRWPRTHLAGPRTGT